MRYRLEIYDEDKFRNMLNGICQKQCIAAMVALGLVPDDWQFNQCLQWNEQSSIEVLFTRVDNENISCNFILAPTGYLRECSLNEED